MASGATLAIWPRRAGSGWWSSSSACRFRTVSKRWPPRPGSTSTTSQPARGEDYELLATVPPGRLGDARRALEAAGDALTPVGAVREGTGVVLVGPNGSERQPSGFDQLRG